MSSRDEAVQLRLIADSMPAMSVAYDEHMRCVFANRRFAEFFGLTTTSIVGRHIGEIIGEEAYATVKTSFDEVLAGRRAVYERTRQLEDGEVRHLSVELIPNTGADGRSRGLFAVTTDVTERKLAEQGLLVANQQLHMLIQSSPVAIYTRDANGRLTSWNSTAEAMFGWTAAEVLGKPLPTVPAEDRAESDAMLRRVLAGETFIRRDARRRRRDGSVIDLAVFIGPLRDGSGSVNEIITVAADITERKKADEDLRQFRTAMDTSGDGILHIDRASLRYVDVNQTLCDLVGYTREELLGMTPMDLFSADRATIERDYDALIADNNSGARVVEGHYRHKDGRLIPVETRRRALQTRRGWIIVGSARDITERKRAEESMRQSASELHLLIDNVPAMILDFNRSLRCMFANKQYADFFGLDVGDLIGKPLREIVGVRDFPTLEVHFQQALAGRPVTFEWSVKVKSGATRCIEVKLVPRAADKGEQRGCYFMAIDITEKKLAAERIQHMASHDSLTGLPNRLLFHDRLDQAISFAKRNALPFALLYLDLDKFKPVNDTYGHAAGDELLKRVAQRIRKQVRDSDTVARLGGDEFTVILHRISGPPDAAAVAQKIIGALGEPFRLANHPQAVKIGTSVGIAVYPGDAQEHEALIKKADAAMYNAKTSASGYRFSES